MTSFSITFPDGSKEEFAEPVTGLELIAQFGEERLKNGSRPVYALLVNNELCSLSRAIDISSTVAPVMDDTAEGSNVCRRTLCFILSAAAASLYPGLSL